MHKSEIEGRLRKERSKRSMEEGVKLREGVRKGEKKRGWRERRDGREGKGDGSRHLKRLMFAV